MVIRPPGRTATELDVDLALVLLASEEQLGELGDVQGPVTRAGWRTRGC